MTRKIGHIEKAVRAALARLAPEVVVYRSETVADFAGVGIEQAQRIGLRMQRGEIPSELEGGARVEYRRGRWTIHAPEPTSPFDLRLGRWQDVLAGVECDSQVADPPYGERTHAGHNNGSMAAINGFEAPIDYTHWTPDHVHEFVRSWSPRTRGWMVNMTSHDLLPAWEAALEEAGRLAFAPLPYVDMGKGPRVLGDGPANWTVQIIVARPRSKAWLEDWRRDRAARKLSKSLPGAYLRSPGDVVWTPPGGSKRIGGKPLGVMRAIVRDYSRPGDLVCDPFAGHGTTLLAAAMEDRRAVGSEMDEEAHAAALERLGRGYTLDLFGGSLS